MREIRLILVCWQNNKMENLYESTFKLNGSFAGLLIDDIPLIIFYLMYYKHHWLWETTRVFYFKIRTCMNPHSSLTAVLPDFWLTIFHWLFSIWCIINIIDSEKQPEFFILKLENGESNVLIASEPKFHSKCLYHNTENGFFVTKRNAGWYKCRKEWLWFILPNKCED